MTLRSENVEVEITRDPAIPFRKPASLRTDILTGSVESNRTWDVGEADLEEILPFHLIGCKFEHVAVYTQSVSPITARDDYDYPEAVIKLRNGDYLSLNGDLLRDLVAREQNGMKQEKSLHGYHVELQTGLTALDIQQKKITLNDRLGTVASLLGWSALLVGGILAVFPMMGSRFDSKIARKYEGEPVEVNGQTFRVQPKTGIVSTGSPSKGIYFDFSRASGHRACVTLANPDTFPHPSLNLLSTLQEACGPVMAFKEGEQPRTLEAAAFTAYRQIAYPDAPKLTVDAVGQLLAQQRRNTKDLRPQ